MIKIPRPRVFVSSTYYDLRYIRDDLEAFIENYGFEPILFERGQIPYDYERTLNISCRKEVRSSQMMILIVGGRYGSVSSETIPKEQLDSFFKWYNSITREEYLTAAREGIPIYVFIDKQVHNEYYTFLRNKNNPNVRYATINNVNVFRFIEEIHHQLDDSMICDFERFDDIKNWLKNQWAGLFYDYLTSRKQLSSISSISEKISELGDLSDTMKIYLERMLKASSIKDADQIIGKEEERLRKVRDSRAKSKIMDSPMMQYMNQHTNLDKHEIFEIFCLTNSLKEFLLKLEIKKKARDYILSEPLSDDLYEEYKKMLANN